MTNRLRKTLRAVSLICGISLLLLFPFDRLRAQSSFFVFTAPSPNVFPVGSTCSNTVSNTPPPTVVSTVGANIITSQFDVSNSYAYTDTWSAPLNNLIVKWLVADDQGHSYVFEYTVSFVDQTPPFLISPPPSTLNFTSIVEVPAPLPLPFKDNCSADHQIAQNYNQTAPPDTCASGTFTRTWTATDVAGNSYAFVQTVNIFADTLKPIITVYPTDTTASCETAPTAYLQWISDQMAKFTAVDPSGIKSYTHNGPPTFPAGCAASVTVEFRATDHCNLFRETTAVFTTSDNVPPAILKAPVDTVAYCSPGGNHLQKLNEWISQRAFFQAADACSPPLQYRTAIGTTTVDSAAIVAAFLNSFANGCGAQTVGSQVFNKVRAKVSVNFFVSDACGKEAFAGDADFAAIDTLPPVITGINQTEACGGNDNSALQAWINAHGNASVADDCSGTVWSNFSWTTSGGQTGNGTFNAGPYPQVQPHNCSWFVDVTFRATDECGNTGAKTLRFQIQDTEKPVISGYPNDVFLPCTNPVPPLPKAYITDNCDTATVITQNLVRSDSLCDGSYKITVTWFATDDCNNTGTAVQTFLVRDTVGPVFTLVPPNQTFYCDTFVLPASPVLGVNINAADNCSPVTAITTNVFSQQNPDLAHCGHYNYNIIRTFTAVDECGNTRTTTQVLTVVDNVPPVPAGLFDTTANCQVLPAIPLPPPTATDACSGPTAAPVLLSQVKTDGNCTDQYTVTLTWRAQDVCGNTVDFTQTVNVIDTIRPALTGIPANITVECDGIPSPPANTSFGSSDNCDNSVDITFLESELRNPDPANCDHWTDYTIVREWTATDNCGNTRRYTQMIEVTDKTPPVLVPLGPIVVDADNGLCGATLFIPPPLSLYDLCTSTLNNAVLRDTSAITGPFNPNIPADTVHLLLNAPNTTPLQPVVSPPTLKIIIQNGDANHNGEVFKVFDENGDTIGNTNTGGGNCTGTVTTIFNLTATQLNSWLSDGLINFTLAPNLSGPDVINAVCMTGKVYCELTYQYTAQQVPVDLKYSLNDEPALTFPPSGSNFLDVGTHSIEYIATDCAGNTSTASTVLVVTDTQAPIITPPDTLKTFVSPVECKANVMLPFPQIFENCDVFGMHNQPSAKTSVMFSSDGFPLDITLPIAGITPNAVTGGRLRVRHWGDNDAPNKFFRIYDENNQLVGQTAIAPSGTGCTGFLDTVINVSAAQINAWAANGATEFRLEVNLGADFMTSCFPVQPDKTDGFSHVQAFLEYSYAVVTYEIKNNATSALQSGLLIGNQTEVSLSPGTYTVKYLTSDIHNLEGQATYQIIVRDTIAPQAKCKNIPISVSVTGSTKTLTPTDVNNGSADNCSGSAVSLSVSPNNFTCVQSPNTYPVTLTVTDQYGNSSTCTASVTVNVTALSLGYNAPLCEGDTLQLQVLNLPAAAPNAYSFMWTGPNFSSSAKNPVINNVDNSNKGDYKLKVTHLTTGCTVSNSINVNLTTTGDSPVWVTQPDSLCAGDDIVLTANYGNAGPNAKYEWWQIITNGQIKLATTTTPTFVLAQADPGNYQFYVKAFTNSCATNNSNVLNMFVGARPTALVDDKTIDKCEGETVIFKAPVQNVDMYAWNGPGGYVSNLQNPPAILNAKLTDAGLYCLRVTKDGCTSLLNCITLTIKDAPDKPLIVGNNFACVGDTVYLQTSNPNLDEYIWINPGVDTVQTNINSLVLPAVDLNDNGVWYLQVTANSCISVLSDPVPVDVKPFPKVSAIGTNPVCKGTPLILNAMADSDLPSWTWTFPGGSFVFLKDVTVANPASGIYRVIGKNANNCADTAYVSTTVVDLPVIDSVWNVAPKCSDGSSSAQLFSEPSGAFQYFWYGPNSTVTLFSPLASPVIPNVGIKDNGTYTLIVKDANGCFSLPKATILNVGDTIARPQFQNLTPITACSGDNVTLAVQNAPSGNAVFYWIKPSGDTVTTTMPSLTLNNVTAAQSGNYRVFVVVAGCRSGDSAPKTVNVTTKPVKPQAIADQSICEGASLFLDATSSPGATFTWTGPGYSHTGISNPVVPAMDTTKDGYYIVRAAIGNCLSDQSDTVLVTVKNRPKTPLIVPTTPQPVCWDQPGAQISLNVYFDSQTDGAFYTWTDEVGDTVGGPTLNTNLTLANLQNKFSPGEHFIKVTADKEGCVSFASAAVKLQLDTIPDQNAFAGVDGPACVRPGDIVKLRADSVYVGYGTWSKLSGPTVSFNSLTDPKSGIQGLIPDSTYFFVWSLSYGGCLNYDRDTVKIWAVAPEIAEAGDTIETCLTTNVVLNAKQGKYSQGFWSNLSLLSLDNVNKPNAAVTAGLENGNQYFPVWTLPDAGCGISTDATVIRIYSVSPFAGDDDEFCSEVGCTSLVNPKYANFETGAWSGLKPGLTFTYPTVGETNVCGLELGPNALVWEFNPGKWTNNPVCKALSRDTVIIKYHLTPTANDDVVQIPFGSSTTIKVQQNDVFTPSTETINLLSQPTIMEGLFETLSLGEYKFSPATTQAGKSVTFTYRICNKNCLTLNEGCDEANVTFNIGEAGECEIYNVITPNNDGLNEYFVVPDECRRLDGEGGELGRVSVIIYNQWGDVIFEDDDYQNTWDGRYQRQELPAGTYFYVVTRENGEVFKGFLILQR